jgi:small subunit ribosomal protein S6
MNKYEVAVVISSTLSDDERASVLEQVKGYIAKYNGVVSEVDEWGKRKLAYEIRKQSEGYYYFIKVDAEPSMAVELEKNLRLMNETVLRYLIVREGE